MLGRFSALGSIVQNCYCIVKTLIIKYDMYANIFAEKMCVAFALAKATHIFISKNTCELDVVPTTTVNIVYHLQAC